MTSAICGVTWGELEFAGLGWGGEVNWGSRKGIRRDWTFCAEFCWGGVRGGKVGQSVAGLAVLGQSVAGLAVLGLRLRVCGMGNGEGAPTLFWVGIFGT